MPKLIREATDAPPGTQPTLREIIDRIYGLESNRDSDLTSQLATDKGQAATIQALSRQLSDIASAQSNLLGRVSYAQFGTASYSRTTQGTDNNVQLGPVVTFELTEPRAVSITATANGLIEARSSNTSNANARVFGGVLLNGGVIGDSSSTRPRLQAGITNGTGSAISIRSDGTLSARALVNLNAGVHNASFIITEAFVQLIDFGGGPTISLTVNQPSVIVDVLQPV